MEPFIAAYKDALQNYAKFDGRLGLGGYWRFFAVNVVIGIVLWILANAAGIFFILYVLYVLATLVPGLAAGVRRLHDTGKSGWFLLMVIIPIVGVILLIVALVKQGEPGSNAYGDPVA